MSVVAIQSPSKYIQGAGVYDDIAKYLSPVANKFVILVDPFVLPLIKDRLEHNLSSHNISYIIVEFGGECCQTEVKRVMQLAIENHCLAILGIGGGKTLDTAKAVGFYAKFPIVLAQPLLQQMHLVQHFQFYILTMVYLIPIYFYQTMPILFSLIPKLLLMHLVVY